MSPNMQFCSDFLRCLKSCHCRVWIVQMTVHTVYLVDVPRLPFKICVPISLFNCFSYCLFVEETGSFGKSKITPVSGLTSFLCHLKTSLLCVSCKQADWAPKRLSLIFFGKNDSGVELWASRGLLSAGPWYHGPGFMMLRLISGFRRWQSDRPITYRVSHHLPA